MSTNTGFKTAQRKQVKPTLTPVSTLDPASVVFDDACKKYKSADGKFVGMAQKVGAAKRPLTFQARGCVVSFAGTSKNPENMAKDELMRNYSLMINAVKDDCPYVSGKKGEGPALYKFTSQLEDLIGDKVTTEDTDLDTDNPDRFPIANAWGCVNKIPAQKKKGSTAKTSDTYAAPLLRRLAVEGNEKLDRDTKKPTGEFWDNSIAFKLRLAKDAKNQPTNRFTTLFVDAHGKDMNVTTSNLSSKIPRDSFAILTLEYNRLWVKPGELKIIANVKKAQIVAAEKEIPEADGFENVGDEDDTDVSKPAVVAEDVDDSNGNGEGAGSGDDQLNELLSDED